MTRPESPRPTSRGTHRSWLRRVLPDVVVASCAALAAMVAIHVLEAHEHRRMVTEIRAAATDGLTMDERLGAFESSIRWSVGLLLPSLALAGGVAVGFGCRHRRWAWLTAIAAALPSLTMGVAYFVDRPVPATVAAVAYALCAALPASAVARLRSRSRPPGEADRPEPELVSVTEPLPPRVPEPAAGRPRPDR